MQPTGTVQTFKTSNGVFAVDVALDAQMTKDLRDGKPHQEDTVDILSKFVEPGGIVIDAGAHIGTFSVPLALRGMHVIAFEPSVEAFALLTRNQELNHVALDARRKGLGSSVSRALLVEGDTGNAGSRSLSVGKGDIEVVRLDDEVSHADAIKIDVEGMELSVLQGARRLLEHSHPVILFEVNLSGMRAQGAAPREVQKLLRSFGYRLFLLGRDGRGNFTLGNLGSLSFAALCIAPGTVLLGRQSPVFDVLALPSERILPIKYSSKITTHARLMFGKFNDLARRYASNSFFK